MQGTQQTVRVFISSTFRDMHAERDHLVTVVFPELRERVEQLGLEFFDVDLRWGVPAKDLNGETANSWEYCRQWIDRVEPFFVCILGQRYGWVPEPEHFRDTADRQRQEQEPRSITDLEVRHAVLDQRRKRSSYFYLRATPVPEPNTEYVDPPEYQGRLKQLKSAVRQCGRPVRDYSPEWTGQGFVGLKEFGDFVLEDLWSGVLRDERYISREVWRQVLNADPDTDPRYTDECQPVPRQLWEKVIALAKPSPQDPLNAERQQMEAFAASRLRWFEGRTHELQQLTDFIDSTAENTPRLAVVVAAPGQGKSALLAKLSQSIQESAAESQKQPFLITHFVGATERSATAHALVQRLLDELDRSGIEWPADEVKEGEESKRDFNSLCNRLRQRLGDYAGDRRIVILLDALNQLTDRHDLVWLPHRLGPSVRVVVSCVEEPSQESDVSDQKPRGETELTPEQQVLRALTSRQPTPLRIPLGPLTEADVRTIVVEYLKEYCKELDREHVDAICRMEQAKNPLYLLVMLGELRTLGGNDMNRIVGERITALPHDFPDTVALFRWVLQRLEVFGADAVRWWCLYLAHGRVGMASHELADLLVRKLGLGTAATALRIKRGLRRYLQRRGEQMDFFHAQLCQAVLDQYSPEVEPALCHSDIATYFRDLADPEDNRSWKGDSARPFLQVAFHLGNAGEERTDELVQILSDLRFVEARCRLGQVFDLQDDYQRCLAQGPSCLRPAATAHADAEGLAVRCAICSTVLQVQLHQLGRLVGCPRCSAVIRLNPFMVPAVCRLQPVQEAHPNVPAESSQSQNRDLVECSRFVQRWSHLLALYPRSTIELATTEPAETAPARAADRLIAATPEVPHIRLVSPRSTRTRCAMTFLGHHIAATGVAWSPEGRLLVTASADTIKFWELATGREVPSNVEPVPLPAVKVAWSPSGRFLVVVGSATDCKKGEIRVYDGKPPFSLRNAIQFTYGVLAVAFDPWADVFACVGGGNQVGLWNCEPLAQRLDIRHEGKLPFDCTIIPGGRWLAVADHGGKLTLYETDTLHLARQEETSGYAGMFPNLNCCNASPDGGVLVAGAWGATLHAWNLNSPEPPQAVIRFSDGVSGCEFSPDGERLACSTVDGWLHVFGIRHGIMRALFGPQRHGGRIQDLAWNPCGCGLVTAASDKTVIYWEFNP
jgi:WD40 repeat protein